MRLSWLVREPSAQAGGLPGYYLVKSIIPLFAVLMLLQALAVIGRSILVLAGRERPPPAQAAPGSPGRMIDGTGELLAIGLFAAICGGLDAGLSRWPSRWPASRCSSPCLGHALGHFDLILFMSLAPRFFGVMLNETLVAVPLFIFMGLVLERSGIAESLLRHHGPALRRGCAAGLGFSVVIVGAILAASTGVVGATVVTMSLISLPTMLRAGYDRRLACGTICAAATLAQIIPPSTVLIFVADILQGANQPAQLQTGNFAPRPVSVGDLFAGALLPGLLLVSLYPAAGWPGWPGGTRERARRCR